jgi:ubiquinone/menaquinone biosynthesis C-methylase UbiE
MNLLRRPLLMVGMVLLACTTSFAQLGTRPADDWIKTLDSPERLASLQIPEVVAALKLPAGAVVADLGAGSGPFVPAFAKAVGATGRVYAVEIDKAFLPHIEAKARAAGVSNVTTVAGELSDPKLPGTDVDVAFLHDALHHIANRATYLRNVTKYMKVGGRIAVIDYNPANSPHANDPSLQVSKQQADVWLRAAGFALERDVTFAVDKWFVIYKRQ